MAPRSAPPPPAKGMSPQDYYGALTSQGFRPWEAYQAVQANFGPPKSPQQQAEEMASAEQNAALAQTGGTVLGAVGTSYGLGQLGAGAGAAGAGAGTAGTVGATGAYTGGVGGMAGVGGTAGAGAAGAGTAGAGAAGAGAGTAGAGGMSAGAIGGIAALGAVGLNQLWEGGMKDILRGRGTREDYINTGLMVGTGGLGGLPNLALRLMGKRSIGKMMTTGKSDAQLLRDDFRGKLKETGVADEDYKITLANGDKYDIGKDGKAKLTNIDGKTTRRTWDVDWENPLAKYAVDKIDPRVRSIYTEEAAKAGIPVEQYTGMLVNAATYNAKSEKDVEANINAMLGKSGLDKGPGATTSKKPGAPIAVRPPAPLPPGAKPGPIETPTKKQSIGDILRSFISN